MSENHFLRAGWLAAVTIAAATTHVAPAAQPSDSCDAVAGLRIEAHAISLPTRGAVIESATRTQQDRLGAAVEFCAVVGRIDPVDSRAPPIRFQVNLPEHWNGKALQYGGGGYNGRIPDATGVQSHGLRKGPTPLARGYVTFSDDSGHQSASANDATFAENDEALANFGALHIRKTRDAMVAIVQQRYGRAPARMYFAGGSTGGREGLTAALRWPDVYDGVISNYPTANFLGLRMENAAIMHAIYQNDSAGWIEPALVERMAAEALTECDALDGVADGIVSNMAACRAGAAARLRRWSCGNSPAPCLNPAQIASTVRVYHEGFSDSWQPQDSTNGFKGYNILEGVAMNLGSQPKYSLPLKEGSHAHAALRADEFLKHFVARDANFDTVKFDPQSPGALAQRLKQIPQLIGATSNDYTRFARRGGKLLLLQGADDALVSPYENMRRYEAIAAAMGPATRQFMRFYVVPGQGHGVGRFQATWDNLEVLDAWVERGTAPPASPVAFDGNEGATRSRPLCEYPAWPRYVGSGDANEAANFSCVASLDNGKVSATLQMPDAHNGYYRGTRFDWSGSIAQLRAAGHDYFGQWFARWDPHKHDAITGPVEDYAPLNYAEAKPGESFVKIGVGVLKKTDDQPYHFATPYEVLDGGRWSVRTGADFVEYRHELNDPKSGFGYVYTKTVRLTPGKAQMSIEHRLRNTGRRAIDTNVYNHGFFMLDGKPTGPDITVSFPFAVKAAREMPGLAEARGRQIVYLTELQDGSAGNRGQTASTPVEGFSLTDPRDFDIRVENHATGAGVRLTSDRPLSRINFWSVRTTVCPEAYLDVKAEPGKEARWRLTYDFYDLKGH